MDEDYSFLLPGVMPADATGIAPRFQTNTIPYADASPRTRYIGNPPMDLSNSWQSEEMTPELMRDTERKRKQAIRNRAQIETIANTIDPLGGLAQEVFGNEQSLQRLLVEYADIPASMAKAVAVKVMTGAMPIVFKTFHGSPNKWINKRPLIAPPSVTSYGKREGAGFYTASDVRDATPFLGDDRNSRALYKIEHELDPETILDFGQEIDKQSPIVRNAVRDMVSEKTYADIVRKGKKDPILQKYPFDMEVQEEFGDYTNATLEIDPITGLWGPNRYLLDQGVSAKQLPFFLDKNGSQVYVTLNPEKTAKVDKEFVGRELDDLLRVLAGIKR